MTWHIGARDRFARLAARMRANRKGGSAAIEFAFVAPILFVLLCGILEVALLFLGDLILQNATNNAAREIRTGQVALNSITQDQFRTMICNQIGPLLQCNSYLQIDVQTFTSFNAASLTSPLNADRTLNTALHNWNTGTVCSIVLVRSFYTWPVLTPLMTPFLANMAGNAHLLYAAAAFRNEPYTTAVSGC